MTEQKTKRFSAKLLFQFRIMVGASLGKRRVCEECILSYKALDACEALRTAKAKGKAMQHNYRNCDGNRVRFEFVGVMDLVCLEDFEEDYVWYDIKQYMLPKERRSRFIPKEGDLDAIRNKE